MVFTRGFSGMVIFVKSPCYIYIITHNSAVYGYMLIDSYIWRFLKSWGIPSRRHGSFTTPRIQREARWVTPTHRAGALGASAVGAQNKRMGWNVYNPWVRGIQTGLFTCFFQEQELPGAAIEILPRCPARMNLTSNSNECINTIQFFWTKLTI